MALPKKRADRQQPQTTCYVTTAPNVSSAVITHALRIRNITPITPLDLARAGGGGPDQIGEAIAGVDLLIAAFERGALDSTLLFEVGYAYALRKRILLIVPPSSGELPPAFARTVQVTADAQNDEAIGFALDQILATPQHVRRRTKPATQSNRPISSGIARELAGQLEGNPPRRALEDVVASAVRASGVMVVVRDERADRDGASRLGIWSDDADVLVGNPFLIEVQEDLRDNGQALAVRAQLHQYMSATSTRTALVVYHHGPRNSEDIAALSSPEIMFLPIHAFLDGLQEAGLGALLRALRARAAERVAA